jgi:hypothetical protein
VFDVLSEERVRRSGPYSHAGNIVARRTTDASCQGTRRIVARRSMARRSGIESSSSIKNGILVFVRPDVKAFDKARLNIVTLTPSRAPRRAALQKGVIPPGSRISGELGSSAKTVQGWRRLTS